MFLNENYMLMADRILGEMAKKYDVDSWVRIKDSKHFGKISFVNRLKHESEPRFVYSYRVTLENGSNFTFEDNEVEIFEPTKSELKVWEKAQKVSKK